MKLLLLAVLVSLQLFVSARAEELDVEEHGIYRRSVNPFARPPPPPRRPIITDDLRGVHRRFARSTDEDFQVFFHREVSPIIQDEIHKAIQEVMNDNGRSHDNEIHDRYRRDVNSFSWPPRPRRPNIADELRENTSRWARDTHLDEQIEPELHRERRDLQIPGYKKPTHRDVIIPNWNPNARTQPWQTIGVRRHRRDLQEEQEQLKVEDHDRYRRNVNPFARPPPPRRPIITDDIRGANRRWARDIHLDEDIESELHRERRDLQIPGSKKPTHRDVIIPNWNPNVRTQPWQRLGVRHRRSYDSRSHASRGTSSSSSSSSHDTGSTHPGYNRRNA